MIIKQWETSLSGNPVKIILDDNNNIEFKTFSQSVSYSVNRFFMNVDTFSKDKELEVLIIWELLELIKEYNFDGPAKNIKLFYEHFPKGVCLSGDKKQRPDQEFFNGSKKEIKTVEAQMNLLNSYLKYVGPSFKFEDGFPVIDYSKVNYAANGSDDEYGYRINILNGEALLEGYSMGKHGAGADRKVHASEIFKSDISQFLTLTYGASESHYNKIQELCLKYRVYK